MMNYFGGWGILGMSMMVLFWIGIVVLLVWAVRAFTPGSQQNETQDALAILQRRYASGEISATEYEQARKTLTEK